MGVCVLSCVCTRCGCYDGYGWFAKVVGSFGNRPKGERTVPANVGGLAANEGASERIETRLIDMASSKGCRRR